MHFTQELRTKLRVVKKVQTKKFYTSFFVLITIAGISSCSLAISSLVNNVIINNTGIIDIAHITANSGSSEDIQAAVDIIAAIGAGTVYIPAGNFSFSISASHVSTGGNPCGVLIPGGVNIIGMGADKTILYEPSEPPYEACMFYVDGRNAKSVRISGITFDGYVETTENTGISGVVILRTTDFRIDHCSFIDFSDASIICENYIAPYGANRGVIDHCFIDQPYRDVVNGSLWGYGVIVWGKCAWLDIDTYMGKYDGLVDTVYIEDNIFSRCRHDISSVGGTWYVARHNVFINYEPTTMNYGGQVDLHGGVNGGTFGSRGAEVYNNTFYGRSANIGYAIDYRGGGGVIFNNTIKNEFCGVKLSTEPNYNPYQMVNQMYIWNTFGATYMNNVKNEFIVMAGITENVNYFLRAPTQGQDGFTYTPYIYPHPLTASP